MQRIFLTSSHLSTLFMTLHARKTWKEGDNDVLIIDHFYKKESLLKLINDTAALHRWQAVFDLSIRISDDHDLQPTFKKRLTRTLKTKPLFRNVYSLLYKKQQAKANSRNEELLYPKLKPFMNGEAELNMLTETALNQALINLMPHAAVNYFEHGLSDYALSGNMLKEGGKFFCAFDKSFIKWIETNGKTANYVRPVMQDNEFEAISKDFLNNFSQLERLNSICKPGKKHALLLMQSVEQYHVTEEFWPGFLDLCLKQSGTNVTYIIKPHPFQSNNATRIIEKYFKEKGIETVILNDALFANTGIEVIFSAWKEQVSHVFSPFSSGLYYLSQLYPSANTTYCYSYRYMQKHLDRAPALFRKNFLEAEELIRKVFAEKCVEI